MKKKVLFKGMAAFALLLAVSLAMTGCFGGSLDSDTPKDTQNAQADDAKKPEIPQKLTLKDEVPQLIVYDTKDALYQKMDLERYLQGVLAGEMRNDWPMEALKAQAILARTYALKFASEKESQYGGADISTDIKEAQAYDEKKVNERIKKAIAETRGEIMSYDGTLPYAWFHAHAGGKTELAVAGLEFDAQEPAYTQSVDSPDSDKAPTAVQSWTAEFSAEAVGKAASETGVKTGTVESIEIGDKGASGRAVTLIINGKNVSAPKLRLALGGTKLKSVYLTAVKRSGDQVIFEGKGYGHGVGMSQWGAYGMAESGKKAEEIVKYYFKNVDIVKMW